MSPKILAVLGCCARGEREGVKGRRRLSSEIFSHEGHSSRSERDDDSKRPIRTKRKTHSDPPTYSGVEAHMMDSTSKSPNWTTCCFNKQKLKERIVHERSGSTPELSNGMPRGPDQKSQSRKLPKKRPLLIRMTAKLHA